MSEQPGLTPMDRLRAISHEAARTYMDHGRAIVENAEPRAVPAKYKCGSSWLRRG